MAIFLFFQIKSQKATLWHLLFFPLRWFAASNKKTFTRLACNEFDFPNRKQLASFPLRCKREQEVQLTRNNRKSFTWHCCNDLNVLEGNELATHRNCKRSSCMSECLRHVAFLSQMVDGKNSKFFCHKHICLVWTFCVFEERIQMQSLEKFHPQKKMEDESEETS